jgi:gliding motility-associated-like protein
LIVFTGGSGTPPYTFTYTVNNGTPQTISTLNGNSATLSAPTNVSGPFVYALVSVQDGSRSSCSANASGSAPVTITVNPLPTALIGPDTSVCVYDPPPTLTFTGTNGTPPYTFVYTINGGSPQTISTVAGNSISISVPSITVGVYKYDIISLHDAGAVACVNNTNSSAEVRVNPKPIANFTTDPQITTTIDPTISLTDGSIGASFWVWDFGDFDSSFVAEPYSHKYADTGIYTINLKIASEFGCTDVVSHTIKIEVPYLFFIPTAFSPNGDGKNEIFTAKGEGIIEFQMMIFDRWGNFIFYTDDIDKGWDGKASLGTEVAQTDVYVYSIKLMDLKQRAHTYRGTVTLVK